MEKTWIDKNFCRDYANEEEKISIITPRERKMEQQILSHYLPDKSKVHVALGVGGGLDFKIFNLPTVERRIGVDISPAMLEICKERYSDAEVVRDDIRSLKKLRELLKNEDRPKFLTILTNTLGNFKVDERKRIVRNVRSLMKNQDLLVTELYKRPELLTVDPGLIPEELIGIKIRPIDLENKTVSEPIPLIKTFPFNFYSVLAPWTLHSMSQELHYSEMKSIQKIVGKVGYSAYWPKTGDMVIYKLRRYKKDKISGNIEPERREVEKYFEPVIFSHRWEGMEIASTFTNAGLLGYMINGENAFITFFAPYNKSKESFKDFWKRYKKLFID
ncbi:MAG: class I SAM-dependent methyltransferase [Candidatus Aenigmatarchaeota archaeon]